MFEIFLVDNYQVLFVSLVLMGYTLILHIINSSWINRIEQRLDKLELQSDSNADFVRNSFNTLAINHDDLKNMFIKHKHIKQIEEVPTTIKKKVEVEKVIW